MGKPNSIDQTTWDAYYKPLTPHAEPKKDKPAKEGVDGTVDSPVKTAVITAAAPGGVGVPPAAVENPVAYTYSEQGIGGIPTGGMYEILSRLTCVNSCVSKAASLV